jgi:flagellar basal-body rod modification protein FlgD
MTISSVNQTGSAAAVAPKAASSASPSTSASFDSLVASLKGSTGTASASASGTSADGAQGEGEDRFLKLLVAQMNNQDPLSPMDNAQVTSQLAQINTVKGIDKLNATMQKMLDRSQSGGTTDAASMVGRQVLVDGNKLEVKAGVPVKAGFDLPAQAGAVRIEVLDAKGAVVDSSVRSNVPPGLNLLEWNGAAGGKTLAAGQYTLRVTANQGQTSIPAVPLTAATVGAVVPGANGQSLHLGALGARALSDVRGYL